MLCSWPLKAPLQIAADSITVVVGTSWTSVDIPPAANGNPPRYVLISWDEETQIHVRGKSGSHSRGKALNPHTQPVVLDVSGETGGLYFFRHQASVTTNVHVTPLENL